MGLRFRILQVCNPPPQSNFMGLQFTYYIYNISFLLNNEVGGEEQVIQMNPHTSRRTLGSFACLLSSTSSFAISVTSLGSSLSFSNSQRFVRIFVISSANTNHAFSASPLIQSNNLLIAKKKKKRYGSCLLGWYFVIAICRRFLLLSVAAGQAGVGLPVGGCLAHKYVSSAAVVGCLLISSSSLC